jgi:hypothetical protein
MQMYMSFFNNHVRLFPYVLRKKRNKIWLLKSQHVDRW